MKLTLRAIVWSGILLAVIFAVWSALVPKPIPVEVAEVIEAPLLVTVREDGKTRIREKYVVSTPVAGRLARIELHSGDEIREKETLLAIVQPGDPAMLDARTRRQAEARVSAAEATLQRAKVSAAQAQINNDLAKSKHDRAKKLRLQNGISRDEMDTAKAEYLASVQAIKSARFGTDIASFELEMAQAAVAQFNGGDDAAPFDIRAPISGKVLNVLQESSQVVSVGTPLLELGDPQNLEMEIDVLSTDAVKIQPGATLTVNHWGGEGPLYGTVRVVEPAAFTKVSSLGVEEQRVNVIADFRESPERIASLGDGYRIEAQIAIEELDAALVIPNSALFRYQREWHVMKVLNDIVRLQPIEIGLQNETHSQILSGLGIGDHVVVYPGDEIKAGSKVVFSESGG